MTKLGPRYSLQQNVEFAASAEFFVGIDSGLSHLAHSVGVPVHLLRNLVPVHHARTTHRGKQTWLYRDVAEFASDTVLGAFRV